MTSDYQPRRYQTELYEAARRSNVIIKMDTGTGKTFIASMVIKDFLYQDKDKKVFFLVKNASLGMQHEMYLKKYLYIDKEIGLYHGQMGTSNIDFWSEETWHTIINGHKIIVMTAKVFLDILSHKKYPIDRISLLIFDEVHHLNKNDDYSLIADRIFNYSHFKILGLTACLINNCKKPNEVEFMMMELESRLRCKIVTTKDSIASEFSTNLEEAVILFEDNPCSTETKIFDDALEKIRIVLETSEVSSQIIEQGFERDTLNSTTVKRSINGLKKIFETLGIYPCLLVAQSFKDDLNNMCLDDLDPIIRQQMKIFQHLVDQICEIYQNYNERDYRYLTEKMKTLLRCMIERHNQMSSNENRTEIERPSFLIFVNEKIQTLALHKMFQRVPELSEIDFITSNFVTGHSSIGFPSELAMSTKRIEKTLRGFKERKFNVLIATNVVEEGQDVPHCNVVIKFDPPQEFRSYIQSRGRARARNAQYWIFSPKADEYLINQKLKKFKQIDKEINNVLKNRLVNGNDDVDDEDTEDSNIPTVRSGYRNPDDEYRPYGATGPVIDINTAAGVLNRYISRLRCNSVSEIKLRYSFIVTKQGYCSQVSLWLPMPSPCMEEIIYDTPTSKRNAKQRVNLKACKVLHSKYKELDESLLPYPKYKESPEYQKLQEEVQKSEQYEKPVAKTLSSDYQQQLINTNPNRFWLYIITFQPNVFMKLGLFDFSMFNDDYSLGFIMSRPFHEHQLITEFPLYLFGGQCQVEIIRKSEIIIDQSQFSIINQCHKKLYDLYSSRFYKFVDNVQYSPHQCLVDLSLVIMKDCKINYNRMEQFIRDQSIFKLSQCPTDQWIGSVIRPNYLKHELGSMIVTKVRLDLTIDSIKPIKNQENSKISYYDYFSNKHKVSSEILLMAKGKPLFECIRLTTIQSCVNKAVKKSSNVSERWKRINNRVEVHCPDLVDSVSLECGLWSLLTIFPTIQHRLNQILLVREFSELLQSARLFDSTVLVNHDLSNTVKQIKIDFDKCYNISNITKFSTPSNTEQLMQSIFPAFVALSCNDRMDLERLEILGDSFLKFITTQYLYHFYPQETEGKLTQKRVKLISNVNLYKLACSKQLFNYFFVEIFDPKSNALIPKFGDKLVETGATGKACKSRSSVKFKNKHLSDCFEALVGAILIEYGRLDALKLLLWFGLEMPGYNTNAEESDDNNNNKIDVDQPYNENNFDSFLELPLLLPNGFPNAFDNTEFEVPLWVEDLESILQYKFKYKYYIIQAITHPSSFKNRKFQCYQRLEFLGDAVLDCLITAYIMIIKPEFRPGTITNLRSSLVNNNTFAYLTVKWGFHKFIDYFDNNMFNLIPDVVTMLTNFKLEGTLEFPRKMEKHKVVVKILGDIFESIAGAIFVDSGYDLKSVWYVFSRLMDEPMKKFMHKIPKNLISQLYLKYPRMKCEFKMEEFTNLIIMTATMEGGKTFSVTDRNKTLCKLTLAKQLLAP